MVVVLRYVDNLGIVNERFISVVHVRDTSSKSLKSSIDSLFAQHKLSMQNLKGQGYNGASNMCGVFNGLKALILRDNNSAFYVHCFARQFELVVVAVARNHNGVGSFFEMLSLVMNVVCAYCQRKDMIQEGYKMIVQEAIGNSEIKTGSGLNQELSLIRVGDTRWGSHYRTMASLVFLFVEVLNVLEYVEKEVLTSMLSQALQRKEQDILEAVSLVDTTKKKLQMFRDEGFEDLLKKVYSFCEIYEIEKVDMTQNFARTEDKGQTSAINIIIKLIFLPRFLICNFKSSVIVLAM